jgi:branched-chain amino acid transport system ATP-binding protein
MLSVANISSFYGETQALFDVSLDVGAGEAVALLGANGAGKTTVLRSILGLTPPRTGRIGFDGRDITTTPTHEIARAGIGWVPDDRRIFPTLKVKTNLSLGRKKTRFKAWREKDCFDLFSALEYLLERDCENLSGGEMQMVAISRVLIGAPGLILLDEPSQGLAPKLVQDVLNTILRLKDGGMSVLVVEQNALSVLDVTDRVYVLDKGQVVFEGASATLRSDKALRTSLLGGQE